MFIDDCITAMEMGLRRAESRVETFNIGSNDQINAKTLANAVIQEVAIENVKVTFTGAVNGGRGWVGDVKKMFLETSKLKSRWWKQTCNSENSIRLTVRDIFLKES